MADLPKETLQEKIKRLGLKPSSSRHPETKAEVIFFLGNKVGAGMLKDYRAARARQEAEANPSTSEPKAEDQNR